MSSIILWPKVLSSWTLKLNKRNWTIVVLIALALLSGIVVKKFIYYSDVPYYEEPLLSFTLQKLVEYGTTLHLLELKTQKVLHEDPYAKLVEEKVMPAHEKMQSIKKQTKIYEDMQRIPGGPQNFMKSALTTVEEIRQKIVAFEEEYYKINSEINREITVLDRETQNVWNQAKSLLTENDLRVTLLKGIFLDMPNHSRRSQNPDSEDFPEYEKRSFEEILDALASLNELAEKYEKAKTEFETLIIKNNITEPEEIYGTPVYSVATGLVDVETQLENRIRDENYQAFVPYVRRYLKKLDDNLHAVQRHVTRKRLRYESLVEMLETDQTSLKERIKRLRFSKPNDEF